MTIDGTYTLEKNEGLDVFLKTLGLKEEKIQLMVAAKPIMTLALKGDKLDIQAKIGDQTVHNVLTIGGTSIYKMVTGIEVEISLTMSGNSGRGTFKHAAKSGQFSMDFTDSHVTEVFTVDGHSCKRIYKRN